MRSILLVLSLFDLIAIGSAAIFALLLRDNLDFFPDHLVNLLPYLSFSLIVGCAIIPLLDLNRRFWRYSTFSDFIRITFASTFVVLLATSLSFAYNRLDGLPRSVPILHLLLIVAFLCASRAMARLHHGHVAVPSIITEPLESDIPERVLVVGVNTIAELFIRSVHEFAESRIQVVGLLADRPDQLNRQLRGATILALSRDLEGTLRQLQVHGVEIDRIVVTVSLDELSASSRTALTTVEDGSGIVVDYFSERLSFLGSVHTAPSPICAIGSRAAADLGRLPSLQEVALHHCLMRPFWTGKRIFDLLVAFGLIALTLPLMLLIAVIVAVDVGTPVLFWQERPGMLGRRLRLYKFRTMGSAHDTTGARVPEADRSSPIGRFLRRSRLDELPQLFHILIGDMSFVGPRPLLPADQSPAYAGRLAVRPGLTGWAQVHGGREISAGDKAAMDIWYIRNANFRLDMTIAAKTLRMLILGDRADARAIADAWKDAKAWKDASNGAIAK